MVHFSKEMFVLKQYNHNPHDLHDDMNCLYDCITCMDFNCIIFINNVIIHHLYHLYIDLGTSLVTPQYFRESSDMLKAQNLAQQRI